MKLFTLTTLLLVTYFSNSQISIDHTDFYTIGDSVGISTSSDQGLNYSSTGQDFFWDFSQLSEDDQIFETARDLSNEGTIINMQFGPFAPNEYHSDYFQKFDGLPVDQLGNILPIDISSVNKMVKQDTNQLTIPGYSLKANGQLFGFRSDTIETAYEFPLSFGDSYSSDGYTDINLSPMFEARIIMNRHRESTVDGYGQLKTPYETYEVLRIHHKITEQDSIYVELGPINQWFPIDRTTNEYEWWAKDMKRPVLKIETETAQGSEVISRITFKNNQTAHLEKNNLEASIYPNPTKGALNIKSNKTIDKVNIFSADGRQVFNRPISENISTINLSHLAPGVYTIQLISKNAQSFSSIVIE